MVEYRDRLEQALDAKQMEPNKLASEIDVSYQAVKKVLDGKSSAFSAPNHAKAAKVLDVSSDWLALGIGNMNRNAADIQEVWPFSAKIEDYRRISEDKKRELDAKVSGFIDGALPAKRNVSPRKSA